MAKTTDALVEVGDISLNRLSKFASRLESPGTFIKEPTLGSSPRDYDSFSLGLGLVISMRVFMGMRTFNKDDT